MKTDGISYRERLSQRIENYSIIGGCPKAVKIELSSVCNLKCKICFNKFSKRHTLISDEDFNIALKNIKDMRIKQVGLLYLGESTLHPNLVNYIKRCKEEQIDYVFLTTNGVLIKDDLLINLMNSGLDSLKFSINQSTKEEYALETGSTEEAFNQVVTNLKNCWKYKIKHNIPMKIYVSTVVENIEHISDDMNKFINNEIKPCCDEHIYNNVTNHGGLEDGKCCSHIKDGLIPCPRLFNNTYICSNLDVMLCCNGFTDDFKLGNLKDDSLRNIWNCDRMVELRDKHLKGNLANTICAGVKI